MTHPFSRRRERRLAIAGGYHDDGESVTDAISRLPEPGWDARTVTFTGASGLLPAGGTFIVERAERVTGPLPAIRDGGPQPGMFPALPPAPQPPPVLAYVPVTEPAVIGDQLRLPVIWCDAAACIAWHYDPDSRGEQDSRGRAIAAGWRPDAFGRLICPACQQRDPGFRATHAVAWHHLEVARAWHEDGEDLPGAAKDQLAATAEYSRRITREDPALARDLAGATQRHERRTAATGVQRLPAAGWQRGRHAGGVR